MATIKHPVEDTIRVLFIEDDPAVAEMYKLKLELDGYQVKVVSSDDQVMQEAAAASNPSAVVASAGNEAVPIDTEIAPPGSSASRSVPPTRRASDTAPT